MLIITIRLIITFEFQEQTAHFLQHVNLGRAAPIYCLLEKVGCLLHLQFIAIF
jgi:hypothetical protein